MNYSPPRIKLFGFGGCGCNTVTELFHLFGDQVEMVTANTDKFSLSRCKSHRKILLGEKTCQGLGTGGDKKVGGLAAEESYRELIKEMKETSLVFFTAGMGGGTGSGAIEIAARISSSLDIPSISFVALPFSFESDARKANAYEATLALQPYTNTLITIPNDKLLLSSEKAIPIVEAFKNANSILRKYLSGLLDLIDHTGIMHIDLSYIINAFNSQDGVFISRGEGKGSEAIEAALEDAFNIPLLESEQFKQTNDIVMKLSGNISVHDTKKAISILHEKISSHVDITPIIASNELHGNSSVSLLLSGIGALPISYPSSWSKKPRPERYIEIHDNKKASEKDELQIEQFQDILEVPAFLRKAHN